MRWAWARRTNAVRLHGHARAGVRTKQLVKKLQPGEIAVIRHEDLDEVAAEALIAARVKAVVNTSSFISGRYPNLGPLKLVQAGVVLLDEATPDLLNRVGEGAVVSLIDNLVVQGDRVIGRGQLLQETDIVAKMAGAMLNVRHELEQFVENTLAFAEQEKGFFLGELPQVSLKTPMRERHVLVVVRGPSYKEDLRAIDAYIREMKPVLIGVDGGADALLEAGFRPHLIVGDMDSVSDAALCSGAEVIVHAYPDGRAPGAERVSRLGVTPLLYPAPGTSEDVAMLIAHEQGAELIAAVGTHSNMIDFLEKGRRGMASTVLTRMRIGNKLVDAKGVSVLYKTSVGWKAACPVILAAMVPIGVLLWLNPLTRSFWRMVYWKVKLFVS
jgi:uncharacterized membrane-anchored protein